MKKPTEKQKQLYEEGFAIGYEKGKKDAILVIRDTMNELMRKKKETGAKNEKEK